MKTYKSFIAAMAVLLLLGFADLSVAVRRVVVRVAPPAPRVVVVQKKCPYKNGVWVAGRWDWRHNKHVWVDGYCVKARSGFAWIDGHWVQTPDGWEWIAGHWKRL